MRIHEPIINKQTKCQPTNVEEIMELGNHYFVGVMAITDSGKNHQCRLKLLCKRLVEKKYIGI